MFKKLALAAALAACTLVAAPANANEHRAPMVPVHETGIAKLDHVVYHMQWTSFAISEGIRTRSVGRFVELYRDQSLCADDVATGLLFTPTGTATLGLMAFAGVFLFGRSRRRNQRLPVSAPA